MAAGQSGHVSSAAMPSRGILLPGCIAAALFAAACRSPPLVEPPVGVSPRTPQQLMGIAEWMRGHSFIQPVRVRTMGAAQIGRRRSAEMHRPPGVASTYAVLGLYQSEWSRPFVSSRCSAALYSPGDHTVFACANTLRDLSPRRITSSDNLLTSIGVTALTNIALGPSLYAQWGSGQHHLAEARRREAEHVLVHEFVHALQHQRLGLAESAATMTTDAIEARKALIEGDAGFVSWAMTLSARGNHRPGLRSSSAGFVVSLRESLRDGAIEQGLPHEVARQLSFRYADGLRLTSELYSVWRWPAVDAAHFNPPASTSEVLHPQRYLNGERPEAISVRPVATLERAGFARVGTDTVGEFILGSYVSVAGGGDFAVRQVAGWRGDQIRVYRGHNRQLAAVWLSSWADAAATELAHAAIEKAHAKLREVDREQALLERFGTQLVIARGIPRDLQSPLRAELAEQLRGEPVLSTQPVAEATP